MTYEQIIQSPGKMIDAKIYYINTNEQTVNITNDEFQEVTLKMMAGLTGTLMNGMFITSKVKINNPTKVYLEVKATLGTTTKTKIYGAYYMYKETYNADDKTYSYELYDEMLQTMVDYNPIELTYPDTVQVYFNKLIETLGLTSNITLINGSLEMPNDIYDGINFTYRSVLQDIAEANGILLYIDGTEVKEAHLGTATKKATINDDILMNTNIDFGEHFGAINTIVLSRSADSDNIYYPEVLPLNPKEYKITDNQLMNDNNREDYLPGIYSKLNGIEYDIFDTQLVGYGGFDPLQKVEFTTGGKTYNSYVLNNEITITDGYEEVIYTDMPEAAVTDYSAADSTDKKVRQAYIIVNKQQNTIESVVKEIGDREGKETSITQDLDSISSKVENIADVTTEDKGTGTRVIKNVLENKIVYLSVHPTNKDIVSFYASNDIYASESLKPASRGITFRSTSDTVIFQIPENLYYFNSKVYDEYIQDNVEEKSYIIKRVGINSDGTKYKLSKEEIHEIQEYNPILLKTSDQYLVYSESYSTAYIDIIAMVQNNFTSQFATKVELKSEVNQTAEAIVNQVSRKYTTKDQTKSQIQQTANEINLSVDNKIDGVEEDIKELDDSVKAELSLKLGKDENDKVVSMLNASADRITLTGNRVVINSTNFQLSADGSIKCNNAELKGDLYNYSKTTGGLAIKIENTRINMYSWTDGSYIGKIHSTTSSSSGRNGITIGVEQGNTIGLGYINGDSTISMIQINTSDTSSVPYIRNTFSGRYVSSAISFTVKNGLITSID